MKLIRYAAALMLAVAAQLPVQSPALAQDNSKDARRQAAEVEFDTASRAAEKSRVPGPANVTLIDQASLKLPAGQFYIPHDQAAALLKAMGNRVDDRLIGMILPAGEKEEWMVVVKYEKSGYIKDDDARDWKADELLDNIKSGTESANKERRDRGIAEMEVIGWAEKPAYDAGSHRLVWSILSRDKGAPAGSEQGINYNTYALGREGYISMNLVTDAALVDKYKPVARQLLGALDFNSGKRYADFNSTTDKVAEYGLAALVGGIAAKKLGLFAVIAAFFLKFIKVILLGLVALVPGLGKLLKRKPKEDVEVDEPVTRRPVANPATTPATPANPPKPRIWSEEDREKAWQAARAQSQGNTVPGGTGATASAPPPSSVPLAFRAAPAPAASKPADDGFPSPSAPTSSSTDGAPRL